MMKLGTVIFYLKQIKNIYINHVTYLLSSADISIFHLKSANFATSRNKIQTEFSYIICTSFNFPCGFNNCFNKYGYNFDDVSKNNYSRPSFSKGILK